MYWKTQLSPKLHFFNFLYNSVFPKIRTRYLVLTRESIMISSFLRPFSSLNHQTALKIALLNKEAHSNRIRLQIRKIVLFTCTIIHFHSFLYGFNHRSSYALLTRFSAPGWMYHVLRYLILSLVVFQHENFVFNVFLFEMYALFAFHESGPLSLLYDSR